MSCFEFYSSEFGIFIGIGTSGVWGNWWSRMEVLEVCGGSWVWTKPVGSYCFHYGKIASKGLKFTRFVCVYIYICFINFFNYQIQVFFFFFAMLNMRDVFIRSYVKHIWETNYFFLVLALRVWGFMWMLGFWHFYILI